VLLFYVYFCHPKLQKVYVLDELIAFLMYSDDKYSVDTVW
jgi:hypothetical protein